VERTAFNMAKGEEVTVKKLPDCDFCKREHRVSVPARFDARTTVGPWAYMCKTHMQQHGVGVGIGIGQRLWLPAEKHFSGEVPIIELPPPSRIPRQPTAECDICGRSWHVRVLEGIGGKSYCPTCLRQCFPIREHGPFTFGDVIAAIYPSGCEFNGEYIGRVLQIPEQNVLLVRFEYEDSSEPDDSHLAIDGLGSWWDVTYQCSGIQVRFGTPAEAAEYEKRRKRRVGWGEGRPTEKQLAPWGGNVGLFDE
jgi:hypothetical protein